MPRLLPTIRNLRARLLITSVAILAVGLGGIIAWAGRQNQNALLEQAAAELQLQAQTLAGSLDDSFERIGRSRGNADAQWASLLAPYARDRRLRMALLDTRLQVVATTGDGADGAPLVIGPELESARQGVVSHHARFDAATGGERMFAAAPVIEDGRRLVGLVQLSVPTAPINAAAARTWMGLLTSGLLVLALAAFASVLLSQHIVRPVRNLTVASEALAGGHMEVRTTPEGPSEIQRLAVAFNRMADRLDATLRRQRELVANAAHELRTPLTGLRLRLELVRAHGDEEPTLARDYLADMESTIDGLSRTVDQLLTLSALDEGRADSRVDVDLSPLLYDLVDELGPVFKSRGLRVDVDVPPHLPLIRATTEQVRIVFRNLLENAAKYASDRGRMELGATVVGRRIEVAVADDGPGIEPGDRERVFHRFFRTEAARAGPTGGSGLGLALVRAIVEAHGGDVTAGESTLGGARFVVGLPTARATSPANARERALVG
ncbi:MAG: HAMP domain-containing sensor histidine kinase [Chloroflexota bacterium]